MLKKEKERKRNNIPKDDLDLIELDDDRVKFLLKDYLRIRLKKIEKFLFYLIKNDLNDLLSSAEFDYAIELYKQKKNYFNENVYKKIPNVLNDFKLNEINNDIVVGPSDEKSVMIRALENNIFIDQKTFNSDNNDIIHINKGQIYNIPYSLIK